MRPRGPVLSVCMPAGLPPCVLVCVHEAVMSAQKQRRRRAVQMCEERQKAPVRSPRRSAVARPRLWRHSMTPRENIYSGGPLGCRRTAPETWTPAHRSRPAARKCGGGDGAVQLNPALPTSLKHGCERRCCRFPRQWSEGGSLLSLSSRRRQHRAPPTEGKKPTWGIDMCDIYLGPGSRRRPGLCR